MSRSLVCSLFAALLLCGAARAQTALPDGAGKEIVESACPGCHEIGRVLRAGYSAEDWRTVLHMMKNAGAQISDSQLEVLTAYLAEHFPERPKRPGATIPGPAEVAFKEWTTPTPGSRPHDPLAALDGTIWYTGQMANVLGRVDPATGRVTEYRLDTPMSGPHGLVADQRRQHLVHRQFRRLYRQARPEHGKDRGIPAAGSDRARSAHAVLRSERRPLVHCAERQHDRTSRSQDRRDQAC